MTDYEQISQENIARYGWDTVFIDLLGSLYSERTHFIFELMQNAEDAGATTLTFDLHRDRLEVMHDGRAFSEADVRGICGVAHGTKEDDLTKIGKFGIGFKSVYAYTRTPHIYSGSESFRIDKYVQPHATARPLVATAGTTFVFPFDREDIDPAKAFNEIAAALANVAPRSLLFLKNIRRIVAKRTGLLDITLKREAGAGPTRSSQLVRVYDSAAVGDKDSYWLIWKRDVSDASHWDQRVEVAFRYEHDQRQKDAEKEIVRVTRSPLVAFFPTAKETRLGFLVQGPYRTTPARDNVPEDDDWNQRLVSETANLIVEVLRELRDTGRLTLEAFQCLPLTTDDFQRTMFWPLFETVKAAISSEPLIAVAGGGYAKASELKLPRTGTVRSLLSSRALTELCASPAPLRFTRESLTPDRAPGLWQYLRDEAGLEEITAEGVVTRLTETFLASQPDEWISQLYEFLNMTPALSRKPRLPNERVGQARIKPIIRLHDGSHVVPFNDAGFPAAYLPGQVATEFPTVRRSVLSAAPARQYLESLGFTAPDAVTEVIDIVLPRYEGLDMRDLDLARHDSDVELIARALSRADADRRSRLLERLAKTTFLIGENAADGALRLLGPSKLHWRTPDTELYFAENPAIWFLSSRYAAHRDWLGPLGISDRPVIRAQKAAMHGYVRIAYTPGHHERGLDRFDPNADIEGLKFALHHPTAARSEYIWNELLSPSSHLVRGVVERSGRMDFSYCEREELLSPVGVLATDFAWLPGPDGEVHRPEEVTLNDLPAGFKRDEALAAALGMAEPFVEEASRQLGVPTDVLRGLSEHPDLVAMLQRELAERIRIKREAAAVEAHQDTVDEAIGEPADAPIEGDVVDYAAELAEVFDQHAKRPQKAALLDDPRSEGRISNPDRRRERVQESIQDDRTAEPETTDRTRQVTRQVWEGKDESVRAFLFEQYAGFCQICDDTFPQKDGTPYFEGLHLVSRTKGRWIDRPGNVICVCPTCRAKFQYGSVVAPDLLNQVAAWRTRREGGLGTSLAIELCGLRVQIHFTEKHLLDLQEILKSAEKAAL
jgi:hypothetical protein